MRTNNLKETTTKPTWEEGANAYHKGLTLAANPYKEGTPDFESWKASFIDSKTNREQIIYSLPAHWAPALINADRSGLSLDEEQDLNDFIRDEHPGYCIGCSEEPYFGRYGGLGCDMLDYTFIKN